VIDRKENPDRVAYLRALREMSPETRLDIAFDLTQFSRDLFLHGLSERYPEKSQEDVERIFLERTGK
jgi:hypothetical protein